MYLDNPPTCTCSDGSEPSRPGRPGGRPGGRPRPGK